MEGLAFHPSPRLIPVPPSRSRPGKSGENPDRGLPARDERGGERFIGPDKSFSAPDPARSPPRSQLETPSGRSSFPDFSRLVSPGSVRLPPDAAPAQTYRKPWYRPRARVARVVHRGRSLVERGRRHRHRHPLPPASRRRSPLSQVEARSKVSFHQSAEGQCRFRDWFSRYSKVVLARTARLRFGAALPPAEVLALLKRHHGFLFCLQVSGHARGPGPTRPLWSPGLVSCVPVHEQVEAHAPGFRGVFDPRA